MHKTIKNIRALRFTPKKILFLVVCLIAIGLATTLFSKAQTASVSIGFDACERVTAPATCQNGVVRFAKQQPATGSFSLSGYKIIDPSGKEFVPVGINEYGPNVANANTPEEVIYNRANLYKDVFKFNTVRFVTCTQNNVCDSLGGYGTFNSTSFTALDRYINEMTAKGIVVMISNHDGKACWQYGFDSDDKRSVYEFWSAAAARYKNNPYVWFNVSNEPNNDSNLWREVHREAITRIRATGARNMIIVDGLNCANDQTNRSNNIDLNQSAIYTYGQELLQLASGNVIFSTHQYDITLTADLGIPTNTTRFAQFVDGIRSKGLALLVGEIPSPYNTPASSTKDKKEVSFESVMNVAIEKKNLGVLTWTPYKNVDGFCLITGQCAGTGANQATQWWNINKTDGAKPTNLTRGGSVMWDYAHLINGL